MTQEKTEFFRGRITIGGGGLDHREWYDLDPLFKTSIIVIPILYQGNAIGLGRSSNPFVEEQFIPGVNIYSEAWKCSNIESFCLGHKVGITDIIAAGFDDPFVLQLEHNSAIIVPFCSSVAMKICNVTRIYSITIDRLSDCVSNYDFSCMEGRNLIHASSVMARKALGATFDLRLIQSAVTLNHIGKVMITCLDPEKDSNYATFGVKMSGADIHQTSICVDAPSPKYGKLIPFKLRC